MKHRGRLSKLSREIKSAASDKHLLNKLELRAQTRRARLPVASLKALSMLEAQSARKATLALLSPLVARATGE